MVDEMASAMPDSVPARAPCRHPGRSLSRVARVGSRGGDGRLGGFFIGVSLGAPMTEFVIPDKGIVYGTVAVQSVEGAQLVQWSYVSDIALARPTQQMFTTFRDDQDFTHLVFGDNAHRLQHTRQRCKHG